MSHTETAGSSRLFGKGRIVFWRGGSVWVGRVVDETGFHDHHAIQTTLSLSGDPLRFRVPGEDWTAYPAAIVAAHASHAFNARGALVALIFTEPESREGRALRGQCRACVAALDAGMLADETAALAAASARGASDEELAVYARTAIAKLALLQPDPAGQIDRRIERAIEAVRERLDGPVTLAEVADAVHLSAERFRHLFLQETGIRFRPYVLWLRLERAVAGYAAGHSLTQASHAAGFADSAHFSRTFRRMFGVPAMGVQRA